MGDGGNDRRGVRREGPGPRGGNDLFLPLPFRERGGVRGAGDTTRDSRFRHDGDDWDAGEENDWIPAYDLRE